MTFQLFPRKLITKDTKGLSTVQTIAVGIFVALLLVPVFSSIMDISRSAREKAQSTTAEIQAENGETMMKAQGNTTSAVVTAQPMTEEQKASIIYDTGQRECYDPPITVKCGANTVSLHKNQKR